MRVRVEIGGAVSDILAWLFDTESVTPHGWCLVWRPDLIWAFVLSDGLIALAYFSIPVCLVTFVRRRRDLNFQWVFLLFGAFILLCGATHVTDVVTLWAPAYGVTVLVREATAAVSVATAIMLWVMMPEALALPSAEQLRVLNRELEIEVAERARAEAALQDFNTALAERVAERTVALERLAAELRVEAARRERAEAMFRHVIEWAPIAILMTDPDGKIELVNRRAEEVFEHPEIGMLGRSMDLLVVEEFRDRLPAMRAQILAGSDFEAAIQRQEWRALRRDGTELPVKIGLSAIESEEGHKILAAVTDISELVQANQRLAVQRDELERSNAELETFAYVASHDLKSPLRGIFLLSQWIEEDLQAGKAAVLAEHMTLMRNRVQRMENLLDDLLTYSRVGRLEGALGMVNVAELARSLFELQAPPPGFRLELAADLPSFSTLGTPFEQVLRNLLSNAVKHHDRAEGAVRLDSAPVGEDFYAFTVSDDGPGIAPQYQERVFGMFQTLKPRDVVEGSGMGLALVKKIVERYGGRVVLRSDGVRGCAVTFTWPCTLAGRAKDDVGGD